MTTKEKLLFLLVLLFLATLFLPWLKTLNIIAASALGIFAVFYNGWKEKWELFRQRKYLLWMCGFFIMVGISVLLSSNFPRGLRYMDPRLPLLYFPLTIGLLDLRKELKQKILLGFALLTCAVMLLCIGWAAHRVILYRKLEFLYNDSLTEVLNQQSIYISLLVNLSIYVFAYHILFTINRFKGWLILAVLFLFGVNYLLASRNMMLVLYASSLGFAFYYIVRRRKYLEGAALVMGLLLGVFLIFKFFPKTFNRYRELGYTEFNYEHIGKESHFNMEVTKDQWNGANFRMAAWRCGWELFLTSPVKGVNIGDKHDLLMEKYKEKNFQFALQTQKNVHNNYLDILYSMGIIGLGLFLAGWIVMPLLYTRAFHDGLSILVILTFAIAWVTEIYFDRSLGGMLTGFFIPFMLTDKRR